MTRPGLQSSADGCRGWWVSKTPLEQKLIILSSVLFLLSFCLTISVIVLDNRKPPVCPSTTTVEPSTNNTSPATESSTASTTVSTKSSSETTVTETPTTKTDPPGENKDKNKEGDGKTDKEKPVETAPEVLMQYPPDEESSAREV